MLGFLGAAFAWGAAKAAVSHRRGGPFFHEFSGLGVPELSEELEFRVGLERVLGRSVLKLSPHAARFGQAALFGLAHPGNELDAAIGGVVYSYAYEKGGLLGSFATHLAHNLGVWAGSK